jgi:hypothetical protein
MDLTTIRFSFTSGCRHVQVDGDGEHEHPADHAIADDLALLERLDDVALLEVLEVGQADAALEALAHLAASSLNRLSDVIGPFQMMTPSRRKRTLEPAGDDADCT